MAPRLGCSPLVSRNARHHRHTGQLDELVAFYRDGIGVPEVGGIHERSGVAQLTA
jgi:hypothetical protein